MRCLLAAFLMVLEGSAGWWCMVDGFLQVIIALLSVAINCANIQLEQTIALRRRWRFESVIRQMYISVALFVAII